MDSSLVLPHTGLKSDMAPPTPYPSRAESVMMQSDTEGGEISRSKRARPAAEEDKSTFAAGAKRRTCEEPESQPIGVRKRKLEFEEQIIMDERRRLLAREKRQAICELMEKNRRDAESAKDLLLQRYRKKPTYHKSPHKQESTPTEQLLGEVRRLKLSLLRSVDFRLNALLADAEAELAADSPKPISTLDSACQTDPAKPEPAVESKMEETKENVSANKTTSLAGEKSKPKPPPRSAVDLLFSQLPEMPKSASNPFLNPELVPVVHSIFGSAPATVNGGEGKDEGKSKEMTRISLFSGKI